jgi:hypothetical protein
LELNSGNFLDLSKNNTHILTTVGIITNTVIGYLYGLTSNLQTQLNSLQTQITTNYNNFNNYNNNVGITYVWDYTGANDGITYGDNYLSHSLTLPSGIYILTANIKISTQNTTGSQFNGYILTSFMESETVFIYTNIASNPTGYGTTIIPVVNTYDTRYYNLGQNRSFWLSPVTYIFTNDVNNNAIYCSFNANPNTTGGTSYLRLNEYYFTAVRLK